MTLFDDLDQVVCVGFSMLEQLSLAKRIALGLAFTIGVIVVFAISVTVVSRILTASIEDYQTNTNQAILLNEYLEDLLEGQVAALAYRQNDTDAHARDVISNLAEITDTAGGDEAFLRDPELAAEVEALKTAASNYSDAFSQTVDLQQGRHDQVAILTTLGQEARVALSDIHTAIARNGLGSAAIEAAGGVVQELLLARLYTERFLLTNDPAALATAKDHLGTLARNGRVLSVALISRDEMRTTVEAALQQMVEFESALDRVAEIIFERNRLQTEVMDATGASINSRIDAALDRVYGVQTASADASQALLTWTQVLLPIMTIVAVGIAGLFAVLIGRSTKASLTQLSTSTRRLAEGDVDLSIPGTELDHEIGDVARALEIFKTNEIERRRSQCVIERNTETQKQVVASLSSGLESLADGDLTIRLEGEFPPEFATVQSNFNQTLDQLNATISEVVETANWISENAGVLGEATDQLSRRNENQAAAIEETSAAATTLSNSVKETASKATTAKSFAGDTRQSAVKGASTVEDTTRAMNRIQASSEKISSIIGLIEDVSFQTNLLALNAGVEAARAGEAGRGFAVVASEVGALSQRSSAAVSDIREIIEQAAIDVATGVETVGQAGSSINEISNMVDQIASLIGEISEAAEEQADSLQSTNGSVKQIDQMTQQNAAMSEETAATAKTLANGAESLLKVTRQFTTTAVGRDASGQLVA